MSLKGRRALITGATGGIGKIAAYTLAELGVDLLLTDQPGTPFGELLDLIGPLATSTEVIECDLEKQDDRALLVEKLTLGWPDRGDGLDIVINNAAFVGSSQLSGWIGSIEEQSVETWRRALEVNLTAVFDLCKGLAPTLREGTGSTIVNIASIYGLHGPDQKLYHGLQMGNPAAYSAAKGGLIQLSRWLATTLAPQIRVNSISPGGIYRNQPAGFVDRYVVKVPLGRMAFETDLRGAIAYLCSDMSSYVTGHNLVVDGGFGCW